MKPICLFACAALLIVLPSRGRATDYYVSPTGSDAAPGTPAQPFQTISKAAQAVAPGDTVIVRPGVYHEAVPIRASGTAQKPITFLAQTPGSVVVTGADPVTGWTRVPGDAPIYQAPWNSVFAIDYHNGKPIEVHPDDELLWGRAEQVIADGRQLLPTLGLDGLTKAWQDHVAAGSPATVPPPLPHLGGPFGGCFAVDTVNKKLVYVWLADGSDPSAHAVQASTRGLIFGDDPWGDPPGVQYVQVKGFVFRYGATFPQRGAVWLYGAHNLVQNCVIEDMSGSGVAVDGSLIGCVIRGCGQTGGSAGGDGFVNENDLWQDNCWKPIDRGWDAGGVKQGATKNGLFEHCVFRRNGGPGLWLDVWVHDVRITQCVFQDNEEGGVFVEISHHIQVDHNLAIGNATGNVGNGAGWANDGITLAESEDCRVTNNTCVGNKVGIGFREQGPRPNDTDTGHIDFHDTRDVVTNNICADNAQYQLGLWYDNPFFGPHPSELAKYPTAAAYDAYVKTIPDRVYDPTQEQLTIGDNLYGRSSGQTSLILYGVPWRPKHQEFSQVAAFTSDTGFGAGSQVADPEFENPEADDYQLRRNSPARAMGAGWTDAPANIDRWINAVLPSWMRETEAALPSAAGPPPGYHLAWSDEFHQPVGSLPDPKNWDYNTGDNGWGNNELENYVRDAQHAHIVTDKRATDGRALQIEATYNGQGVAKDNYQSARLISNHKVTEQYGYIEARIQMPWGQGIWPAFWMLGANIFDPGIGWPNCGEMDIMENIGSKPGMNESSLHGPGYSGANSLHAYYYLPHNKVYHDGYHTFGLLWSRDSVQYSVDGHVFETRTPADIPGKTWVFNHPFFFIMNLAVGGFFPGSPDATTQFPQKMLVDYIRVYEPDAGL